jgi:hypothetical protein
MAQPESELNTRGQSMDTLYASDGTPLVKLGVGEKTVAGLTPAGGWQAAATHADGATFAASDGVGAVAGVDGTTVRTMLVDSLGRPVTVTVPSQGTLTDRSGTITSGAVAQQVAASLTTRKYFFFQNHSDTVMWINFGTNAVADQPSIQVPVNGTFTMQDAFVSTQSISVICATTGKKFTAKEA